MPDAFDLLMDLKSRLSDASVLHEHAVGPWLFASDDGRQLIDDLIAQGDVLFCMECRERFDSAIEAVAHECQR